MSMLTDSQKAGLCADANVLHFDVYKNKLVGSLIKKWWFEHVDESGPDKIMLGESWIIFKYLSRSRRKSALMSKVLVYGLWSMHNVLASADEHACYS